MAAPSPETFKTRFPEFASIAGGVIQFWIDDVEAVLSDAWGDCYPVAVETLAAHRLALSQARQANASTSANGAVEISGGIGAITSASADGLSVSFAVPSVAANGSVTDAALSRTPYGIDYLALRASCMPRGRVAGCR